MWGKNRYDAQAMMITPILNGKLLGWELDELSFANMEFSLDSVLVTKVAMETFFKVVVVDINASVRLYSV